MRVTLSRVVVVVAAVVIALAWAPTRRFLAIDRCLDNGGSYDYALSRCDLERSHAGPAAGAQERTPFQVVPVVLIVAALVTGFAWQDAQRRSRPGV